MLNWVGKKKQPKAQKWPIHQPQAQKALTGNTLKSASIMPLVKSADVFIERSLHLLEINPNSTRISITYGSESKKQAKAKQNKITKSDTSENRSFVSFKTYDPISGQLHKLKTFKTKELSKLLTALGPHGVSVFKPVEKNQDGDNKTQGQQVSVRGFSSVLVNAEVKEGVTPEVQKPKSSDQSGTAGGSKKNKKKKGKR